MPKKLTSLGFGRRAAPAQKTQVVQKLRQRHSLDPQKTDDALYVSSYGCAASDAAAKEFEWTRNLAVQQGMQMPKVIARHLIQSFDVGEVSPEQAHKIGKQFVDEWLKGRYEYVIATHIDKGHCHNHIIFNAVNYVDFHAYRSNKQPCMMDLPIGQIAA
ncbi:relaxase/mobilization nuclease domain-containing protein [Anaeromassilibacillus senegalensis]|uniref:relaxase/mobilization nuclease domain-containing protein n=1 Tax=Anaeromassilibacillus senegalensis TaxID=1673717 RepID=UPI001F213ED6